MLEGGTPLCVGIDADPRQSFQKRHNGFFFGCSHVQILSRAGGFEAIIEVGVTCCVDNVVVVDHRDERRL